MTITLTSRMYDAASDVLDDIVTQFAAAGVTLPTRQSVHAGQPAYDCDELLVAIRGFDRIGEGPQMTKTDRRLLRCEVTLIRCVSNVENPTVAQLDADAQTVGKDGWALIHGLVLAAADPVCRIWHVGDAVVRGPEGGMVGWQVPVLVEI